MKANIIPLIVYPVNMGYVNDLKPIFQGTGEPGATINGTLDNTTFTTPVLKTGVWSYTCANDLVDYTSHTLTVTQTNGAGQTAPSTSVQFNVDTKILVPQTVIYPLNDQFIGTKTPVILGTGKAGAFIETTILNSVYSTVVNQDGHFQIQIETPLLEGLNTLNITQKDKGNISPMVSVSFIIDTVAPFQPQLNRPANLGYENTPRPVVSGVGEANATINAVVDNKEYTTTANQNGIWNFEISESLTDDIHIVSAKQRDLAGNISAENVNVFTVETKQPAAPTVTAPENCSFISDAMPLIKGKGQKDNRIEVRLNNKIYPALINQDGSWNVKITDKLSDDTHTFKIYQVDKAGNVSPSTELTLKIDTSVPLLPVVLYPESDSYVSNTNFTVKGTGEPDAIINCTITGRKYSTNVKSDGSWSIDVFKNENILNSQDYSITAKQIDLAGNESPSIRVKFRVDTVCLKAPQVNFPTNNSFVGTVNPTFSGVGKTGATVSLNINNEIFNTEVSSDSTWSINIGKNLPQGKNIVNIYQSERGNVSNSTIIAFNVDTVIPLAPQITFPTENQNLQISNLTIKGNGEANAIINVKLDDKCYCTTSKTDNTWEFVVPDVLANGLHVIFANQTDTAGNQSLDWQVCFVSNALPPTLLPNSIPIDCKVKYNPAAPEWATKVIAVLTTNKSVTVNNIFGNVFSKIITANGISTFDYTDSEGNNGTISAGVTWIDNKPPVIQVESNGNTFSSDKTITYFKTNGSPLRYAFLNGVPIESGKSVCAEGIYKVEVCDAAGNIATEDFIIDRTAPTVLGIEEQKVYNADVKVTYFDNISGVKFATLNGQNLASGTTLFANGDYNFSIGDFGDNCNQINFKIQK